MTFKERYYYLKEERSYPAGKLYYHVSQGELKSLQPGRGIFAATAIEAMKNNLHFLSRKNWSKLADDEESGPGNSYNLLAENLHLYVLKGKKNLDLFNLRNPGDLKKLFNYLDDNREQLTLESFKTLYLKAKEENKWLGGMKDENIFFKDDYEEYTGFKYFTDFMKKQIKMRLDKIHDTEMGLWAIQESLLPLIKLLNFDGWTESNGVEFRNVFIFNASENLQIAQELDSNKFVEDKINNRVGI